MPILRRGARSSSPSSTCWRRSGTRRSERLLSLPELEGEFHYTAVLGDAPPEAFRATTDQYRRFGFSDFKLKLSGDLERDRAKMAVMRGLAQDPSGCGRTRTICGATRKRRSVLSVARLPVLCDRGAARTKSVRISWP